MFSQKGPLPSGTQPQPQQPPHSSSKQHPWNPCLQTGEINLTAAKRQEHNPLYTQLTPKPQRKILLYGENHSRFLFPLVRDREIGIEATYQNIVIESHNDDDRETTSTQLQRGMVQTLEDLYDVLATTPNSHSPSLPSSASYYTQRTRD